MDFMKVHVAPRMAKIFQGKDAAQYADFGCRSCHGPDWKAPKDYLPELATKDAKITAFVEKPEVAKFMAEKVLPEMASVFGQAPYDPATKTGFGCMGCHNVETK
jgi:cytochrome c551/c552